MISLGTSLESFLLELTYDQKLFGPQFCEHGMVIRTSMLPPALVIFIFQFQQINCIMGKPKRVMTSFKRFDWRVFKNDFARNIVKCIQIGMIRQTFVGAVLIQLKVHLKIME